MTFSPFFGGRSRAAHSSSRSLHCSIPRAAVALYLASILAGCAVSTAERTATVVHEGAALGFAPVRYGAAPPLAGMLRTSADAAVLWVVIEGDGRAWLGMRQPSPDPTPVDAVGWRLARQVGSADATAPATLYLARPCQYLAQAELAACSIDDWTGARFSEKWVARMNAAIDQAKQQADTKRVALAGYSGGGVMAALIAARRTDVAALLTVGAPLDHAAWTAYHRVTPLNGSLSVVAIRQRLFDLPQVHIAGADDKIVPPMLMRDFLRAYPVGAPVRMMELPGIDHRMRAAIDLGKLGNEAINTTRPPSHSTGGPGNDPGFPYRSRSK
ncbi:MAG TPA: alpha/beta hydrolase [Herbaspirillum sp.]